MDAAGGDPSLASVLEPLAFDAWPAAEVRSLGGWRLRFNHGVTNRASSVWPNAWENGVSLDARMEEVERFYAARGEPARYQVSPLARPAVLDEALEARGYERYAPVTILVADVASTRLPAASDCDVTCTDHLDEAWFSVSGLQGRFAGGDSAVYRALLERISDRRGFALARAEGRPAAVGLGVARGAWAGVFSMLTLPEQRRRGLGRAVLAALARWARAGGARHLYLQVEDENAGALALYHAAGFRSAYRYHYRRQAGGSGGAAARRRPPS